MRRDRGTETEPGRHPPGFPSPSLRPVPSATPHLLQRNMPVAAGMNVNAVWLPPGPIALGIKPFGILRRYVLANMTRKSNQLPGKIYEMKFKK
jgi:hypothetical protein